MTEYDPDETFELTAKGFKALHDGDLDHFPDDQLLILRLIDGKEAREMEAPTVAEMDAITKWYQEVMLSISIIEMVLEGEVYVDISDDGEPVFSISSKGLEKASLLGFQPENN